VRPPVGPGEERTIDITPEYGFPDIGSYQIVLTLDAKEVIAESSEDNNVTKSDILEGYRLGDKVIILNVYDSNGNLLPYRDFREVTNGDAYATDLNNLPYHGFLCDVSVDYCSRAIPAFGVVPQTPYKIHVLWEVPEFGKIMLSADNEGKGYSVDRAWGKLTLNFNYEAAKSKLAMLQRDYDLFQSQGYSISASVGEGLTLSKKHLKLAEGYLTQTPSPDMKSAVAELNLSLKRSLWAHEQLYLDRAEADIERYRKGDVKIRVVDEEGKPLSDCGISLRQTSHDFLFATSDCDERYENLVKQAGINCIYTYFGYGVIEPEPGRFEWSSKDREVNSRLDDGFRLIGDLGWLFYRSPFMKPSDIDCPRYLDDMSFEEVKENVHRHMYAIADRYKDKIDLWQAICEPCVFNQFNWTWNQKFEMYRLAASAIKDANPKARILPWNPSLPYELFWSYNPGLDLDKRAAGLPFGYLAEGMPFPIFITLAIEKQIPIDVIGLFIVSGVYVHVTPEHIHLALDLVSLSVLIDQYSNFGKPIFFREHQAPSTQVAGSCWWHRPWDEQTQAEYVEKFYTLMFSKPLMEGIGWSTGFTDDQAEKLGCLSGGLLDANFKPKPSYFALKNLIGSWKTTGTGVTNENGEFELRGFAGDYDITLVSSDGRSCRTKIHIFEQECDEVTIVFIATERENTE